MRHIRNKDGISEQHFVAFEGHTKSSTAVSILAQINTSIRALRRLPSWKEVKCEEKVETELALFTAFEGSARLPARSSW